MNNKKRIGVGLLGTGFMCKAHSNAYKTIPYMFNNANYYPELLKIGGSSEEKAKLAAQRYNYTSYCKGWKGLINDPDIDIIDICTPDAVHLQPALDALAAGKNVICEKPMVLTGEDGARLAKAALEAGTVNMVSFNYRFLPAVRLAYEMINQGLIGDIYHIYIRYFQSGGADPELPVESVWYARSGILQGVGTHAIDQARFLVGEIVALNGATTTHVTERLTREGKKIPVEIEDSARAVLQFESGATGTVECSCVAWGHNNGLEWEISGSKGSLAFNLEEPNYLKVFLKGLGNEYVSGFTNVNVTQPNHPFMDIWWPGGHNLGWEHGHINLIAHLLDCVASNKPAAPLGATFVDGFKTALIIDSIRESSCSGQRIDLNSEYKKYGFCKVSNKMNAS